MAKRELSSTLKNLKFMQREAQREERIEEEKIPDTNGNVFATGAALSAGRRRCIVIIEGDPHPGALRGRISFQNFNPSIDKLNEEAATIHRSPSSNMSLENGNISSRSEELKDSNQENNLDADHEREQPAVGIEIPDTNKSRKTIAVDTNEKPTPHTPNSSNKQRKRKGLDWNLLSRRKAQKEST